MWPLPTVRRELVSITLNPTGITCSWIRPHHTKRCELVAYTHATLDNLEYTQSMLCNPTRISHIIATFLHTHTLNNAWICMSVSGSGIVESVVDVPTATPKASNFPFPKLAHLVWDYRYLYPKDNAHSTFYVCGLSRSLLCQYQLLAINTRLNIIAITTERMALLQTYKRLYGSAFRHSQLARDMELHNQDIHALCTTESLKRMLVINPSKINTLEEAKIPLLTALGLYTIGSDLYGAH